MTRPITRRAAIAAIPLIVGVGATGQGTSWANFATISASSACGAPGSIQVETHYSIFQVTQTETGSALITDSLGGLGAGETVTFTGPTDTDGPSFTLPVADAGQTDHVTIAASFNVTPPETDTKYGDVALATGCPPATTVPPTTAAPVTTDTVADTPTTAASPTPQPTPATDGAGHEHSTTAPLATVSPTTGVGSPLALPGPGTTTPVTGATTATTAAVQAASPAPLADSTTTTSGLAFTGNNTARDISVGVGIIALGIAVLRLSRRKQPRLRGEPQDDAIISVPTWKRRKP